MTSLRKSKKSRSNPERIPFELVKKGFISGILESLDCSDISRIYPNFGCLFYKALEYYAKQPSSSRLEIIKLFTNKCLNNKDLSTLFKEDKYNKNIMHYGCLHIQSFTQIFILFQNQNPKILEKIFFTIETIENRTPLHYAFRYLNIKCITQIYEFIGKKNFSKLLYYQDINGLSCFHVCILRQSSDSLLEIMKLIEKSLTHKLILLQTGDGRSSLHIAGKKQNGDVILKIVDLLGDDLTNALSLQSSDGWTPFHVIAKYQEPLTVFSILELLLEDDIKMLCSITDSIGVTPFHLAISFLDCSIIKILLNSLGDDLVPVLSIPDPEGHNSIHSLVIYQDWDTIEMVFDLLGEKTLIFLTIQDNQGQTPLHLAVHRSNSDIAENLFDLYQRYKCDIISFKTKRHCTILHEFTHFQSKKVLNKFLSAVGDRLGELVLETDAEGFSSLHVAAHYQSHEILKKYLKAVPKKLLKSSIRSPECDGWTIMHYACKYRDFTCLEYLLKILDDEAIDALLDCDNFNATPFHMACKYQSYESIQLLISILGDKKLSKILTKQRTDGNTPLHLAVNYQKIDTIKYFITCLGDNAANIIELQNEKRNSVLHIAARSKNTDILRLIFNCLGTTAKEGVLLEDNKQRTPLHLIVRHHGRTILREFLEYFENNNINLLHYALQQQSCSRTAVSILIRMYGETARTHILETINGSTSIHLAAKNHSHYIIGLLLTILDKDKDISSAWFSKTDNGKNCSELIKKNQRLKGDKDWEIYNAIRFKPGSIPQLKATFDRLNTIDFSFLPCNRLILESIVNFTHGLKLKKIAFKKCCLTDTLFQILLPLLNNQTKSLEILNLSENQITSITPIFDILDKASGTIKIVKLQNNWLSSGIAQFFKLPSSKLKKSLIEEIDISSNFLFIDPSKPKPCLEYDNIHNSWRYWRFISKEDTVASLLTPLHGTDTKHWHVMLCFTKLRKRPKIFLEGMYENGQRFLRCIRIPHFKVSKNIKASNRIISLSSFNLNKYKGKSWPISQQQGFQLLSNIENTVVIDSDSSKNILLWGINLLESIDIIVDINTFVQQTGEKTPKNCLIM